ncbi:MAG: glycosyltransferase family 39 protein [Myxococcaceae bacterium]
MPHSTALSPSERHPSVFTLPSLAGFRTAAEASAIAALLFLPFLGSVGLWDPWETQYAEVARQMLVRGDFIHPYWEHGWFFSKPVLSMWLMVPGLWVTGAATGTGPLSSYTEWLVRLPFALFAIAAVAMLSDLVARCSTPRAGRLTAVALSTMPMFFFVARQAMTDMAYVAPVTVAIAAGARATLLETGRSRRRWWLLAFACAGLATLGKGILGFGIPGLVLGAWALATAHAGARDWRGRLESLRAFLREVPWLPGLVVFAVIALPWYLAMFHFEARDVEGKTFFERFILHDHFARLGKGVHSDSPGGSFTFYVEQLGFGLFPWVALLPGAIATALSGRFGVGNKEQRLRAVLFLWAVLTFALFTSSATRFHHYVLPAVPAIAALIALSAEHPRARRLPAVLFGAVLVALVARDLAEHPKHLADLFDYNHERPYPDFLWAGVPFGAALALGLALTYAAPLLRKSWPLAESTAVFGLLLGVWLTSVHWVELSHHWTQRDLFWRYYQLAAPGEPIAAFWMDWKGETFYSRNEVFQVKPGNEALAMELARRPGRAFFLVEHNRLNMLQQALPGQKLERVEPGLNNKFVLVIASDG